MANEVKNRNFLYVQSRVKGNRSRDARCGDDEFEVLKHFEIFMTFLKRFKPLSILLKLFDTSDGVLRVVVDLNGLSHQ